MDMRASWGPGGVLGEHLRYSPRSQGEGPGLRGASASLQIQWTPGCPQLLGNETSGIRVKPGGVKCGPNAAPHLSSPPLEGPGPGADLPSLHIFTAPVCNPKHHYLHGFMCTSGTVFSCSLLFPLPSAFSHVSHWYVHSSFFHSFIHPSILTAV